MPCLPLTANNDEQETLALMAASAGQGGSGGVLPQAHTGHSAAAVVQFEELGSRYIDVGMPFFQFFFVFGGVSEAHNPLHRH